VGTAGAIRIYKTTTGYRARVLVRDYDGHVRAVERNPGSKIAADRALTLALHDRVPGTTAERSPPTAASSSWPRPGSRAWMTC
jgi:hypothetical protein